MVTARDGCMNETVIASLALVISVDVGLWELIRYLLEGGRVRVRMNPALLGGYSLRSSTKSWLLLRERLGQHGGWYLEVAASAGPVSAR